MPSVEEKIDAKVLLEIVTDVENFNNILLFLDNIQNESPYFSTYEVVKKTSNTHIILIALCSSYGSRAIYESECFFNNCEINGGGIYFNILTSKDDSLSNFIDYLKKCGFSTSIVKKYNYDSKNILTIKEKDILKYALAKGYFNIPKKIKLNDLSIEFNISISSLDEIIKKAQKKILIQYFMK